MPKVLIGIVTYDNHRYCLNRFVEAINSQSFRDFDVLFIDNSEEDYDKEIKKRGFKVIKDPKKKTRIDNIEAKSGENF